MLKVFRHKNVAKVVLWALLILILPAFVMWGTGSMGRGGKKGPTYVGTIDNKKISFEDFGQSIYSIRCQAVLNYYNQQKMLDELLKNKLFLARLAWDRLILLKKAKASGIKASDKEIVKFITSHPIFLRNGKFDDRVYGYFLKNSLGIHPRNFEELTRENLIIQKLTDKITKDVKISDEEVARAYERDNAKFRISYAIVPLAAFTDKVTVTDQEMKDFYEKHRQNFVVPAKEAADSDKEKRIASFDEMKPGIKAFLSESKARPLALKSAEGAYAGLRELTTKNKLSFETSAKKLGLDIKATPFFIRSDYLEEIGEMAPITAMAVGMGKDELSKPLQVRKGILIFRVAEIQEPDQEMYAKEKADYSKRALLSKKNDYTEEWLNKHREGAELKIDLKDYEEYYR